jgi:predicted dehydrogenase
MTEHGFTSLEASPAAAPKIGVGMLGYAFMGRAHSNAYKKLAYMMYPPPAIPKLIAMCGRTEAAVRAAATRFGYLGYYTDWRDMLRDDRIQLFDNGGSNDIHAEPSIAAAQAGKHVLCEKPLARSAPEAAEMLEAVTKAGVKHAVMFNYRFVPALRYARQLIESGALGQIYHYRAAYLQEGLLPSKNAPRTWRHDKSKAGAGALGDLGAHIIDLGRFLVGEYRRVGALTTTFFKQRALPNGQGMAPVDVDDAFAAAIEFENGAIGTLEATRVAAGRKNSNCLEINGEKGSLRFNLERLNELEVYWAEESPDTTRGFHNVLMTEPAHPFIANWWPRGHIIGWEHTFVHEITHLLDAIVNDRPVGPYCATFEDGYKAAVIADALLRSAENGEFIDLNY